MLIDKERAGRSSRQIRRVLFIVIAVLALLTIYLFYPSRPTYQLYLFRTPTGWGYDVLSHADTLIHQPVIPGVAGERGFVDETQARRVGERVINKLQQGKGLPTITPDELREMRISLP